MEKEKQTEVKCSLSFTGESEKPAVSENKELSPEMALRLKRAAFLEQKNNEAIQINRAAAVTEDDVPKRNEAEQKQEYDGENPDVPVEQADEKQEQPNTPNFDERDRTEEIHVYRTKQASRNFEEKRRRNRRQENCIERTVNDLQTVKDISGGSITPIAERVLREYLPESVNTAADGFSTVGGAVKSSDSAESAVMDVSSALAAVEAKKMIKKLAETDVKKQKRAEERAKNNVNRYGIEKYDEVVKKESSHKSEEKDKEPYSSEPKGKVKAGNSHKMQEEKKEYGKKQTVKQIKNKRKEIYFNDNPTAIAEIVNGVPSGREIIKGVIKKKATALILGGSAGAIIVPILVVIVTLVLITAFFGWLTPFNFTLAGDDEGAEPHAAETNAEILDGYTLMVKNCLDVTQAYYYLNYGDWYGGTYDYPDAASEISFSQFFSEKCAKIVADIQASFASAFASAKSPEEAAAISNAMSRAISEALSQAMEGADEEYAAIIEQLNDCLSASSHRQHYEVVQSGGRNGIADTDEFNGLPVVGTNNFGNVEINSDLSAEEMLAYAALYKSLKTMDNSQSADDDETEKTLNISSEDINKFFEETEYFSITATLIENNVCIGENCKRRVVGSYEEGYLWEYYCDSDHQNLSGQIGACKSADELLAKIIEITNAEEMGVDKKAAKKSLRKPLK